MSWIFKDLWKALKETQAKHEALLSHGKPQVFEAINRVAFEVGERHGVFLQVNFPPGQAWNITKDVGRRDLSLLVHLDRKKFQGITEQELKRAFQPLNPVSFDSARFGYEGFKVRLASGRIDCLPGGVHLWCEVTPEVLRFLDWLFEHAYQKKALDDC